MHGVRLRRRTQPTYSKHFKSISGELRNKECCEEQKISVNLEKASKATLWKMDRI